MPASAASPRSPKNSRPNPDLLSAGCEPEKAESSAGPAARSNRRDAAACRPDAAKPASHLWTAAIDKAKEKWGDRWGIAYNGDNVRTQCHVHIHIGRLIEGVEAGEFLVVDGPAQIPVPGKDGYWIHPVNGKLHVHTGEQICETVLLR